SVASATMAGPPSRRRSSSSSGNSTYSSHSTAIDQNAPLGVGATATSCSINPYTATVPAVGDAECGCGTIVHATIRLNASAAQYGGRIRQARRRANSPTPPGSVQPAPAGPTASEKPETTRKNTTARWPNISEPVQYGPWLVGKPG